MDEVLPNFMKPKRPALIWVTQVLIALLLIVLGLGVSSAVFALPNVFAAGVPVIRVVAYFSLQVCVIALLTTLFVGLVRRRRWAWLGSIVFAALLLALLIQSRIWPPSSGPFPILPIAPEQQRGAAVGEAVITLLALLYPFRLYFSRAVRAFFAVQR